MDTSLQALIQAAVTAYQAGDWPRAAQACEGVLRRDGQEPNTLLILGTIRAQSGDAAGGLALLERARSVVPRDINILTNLGATYRVMGRLLEARDTLSQAREIDKRFVPPIYNLGNTLADLGDLAGARAAYERVLVLQPNNTDAIEHLSEIAEREHRLDDAVRLSERVFSLAPGNVTAHLTRARVELRRQSYDAVLARLEPLRARSGLTQVNRAIVEGLIGQALEKLKNFDGAFAAFKTANRVLFEMNAPRYVNDCGPTSLETIERLTSFVQNAQPEAWSQADESTAADPVFLIGFPRSGTTLLDQALASHPAIVTLEERDNLFKACEALMDAGALSRLADMSAVEIEHHRADYWARIERETGERKAGSVFIDKMPLNTILLPLIYRLFPKARVLFALRDPRDVAISCFQQRFGMNAAMFQLLQLDTTARYYDAVMRLGQAARKKFRLRVHEVRYEEVVSDFDATLKGALSFLDLDWDDRVRNYPDTARKRVIATPSAPQVVEPLYASSQGKWRNYANELAPYLPSLEPWVNAFGYGA